MFRDHIPLPAKIRESGEGYTLSGKPLDPNSAAAKPYLNRNGSISGPSKPAKKVQEKKDDPMEGVEQDNKVEQEKSAAMEIDTITKAVEIQTKELTIGDEDKKTLVSEFKENKVTESVKSATPSPSNSST